MFLSSSLNAASHWWLPRKQTYSASVTVLTAVTVVTVQKFLEEICVVGREVDVFLHDRVERWRENSVDGMFVWCAQQRGRPPWISVILIKCSSSFYRLEEEAGCWIRTRGSSPPCPQQTSGRANRKRRRDGNETGGIKKRLNVKKRRRKAARKEGGKKERNRKEERKDRRKEGR